MKIELYEFEGITLEETIEKAEYNLKLNKKDFQIKSDESKEGLFKGKKVKITVLTNKQIIEFVKKYLKEITSKMNISIKIEVRQKDNMIQFMMFTDSSPILIGKKGKTLDSIQILVRQAIYNETNFLVNNIVVDAEYYKVRQKKKLEKLANELADEVIATNVEIKLDDMSAYERKIIHNILMDREEIYTESEGEDPHRHIVIKPNK